MIRSPVRFSENIDEMSTACVIKRAKERGETLNITEDFLVQFLAYSNPYATKIFAMPDIVKRASKRFLKTNVEIAGLSKAVGPGDKAAINSGQFAFS